MRLLAARHLHHPAAEEVHGPMTMEQRPDPGRTRDTVEELEDQDLPNPITERDAELGEAGDALRPEGEAPTTDKDEAEGPVPRTTQLPR